MGKCDEFLPSYQMGFLGVFNINIYFITFILFMFVCVNKIQTFVYPHLALRSLSVQYNAVKNALIHLFV